MADYKEYIDCEVAKETEKAYLVKVEVNNRRDGWHTKFKWVAKSICKAPENEIYMKELPDEIRAMLPKYVGVPTRIIGNCIW